MKRQRYKDLQLVQLRSFCLAATQGNFSEAAKVAGVSRAAIWQQVRALERKLGLTLLRRRGRTVELTQDGRLVLDVVLPHVNGLDSIERLIETKRAELPRRLAVACTPGLLAYDLSRPLQHFARAQPACRVNLLSETSAEPLVRLVESGEADVGVFTQDPAAPRSPYLEYEELFNLELLLLTAADHPLAKKRKVQAAELAEFPFILGRTTGVLRRVQDRILQEHELADKVQSAMETEHTYLMFKYVSLGLGISLWYVSREMVRASPGVHGRLFDPRIEDLPVVLAVRKHAHLPEAVDQFRATVRRFLPSRRP